MGLTESDRSLVRDIAFEVGNVIEERVSKAFSQALEIHQAKCPAVTKAQVNGAVAEQRKRDWPKIMMIVVLCLLSFGLGAKDVLPILRAFSSGF